MLQPPAARVLERSDNKVELSLPLTDDFPCFVGHFDGLPVLAGVVQIGWALHLAEHYFARKFQFQALQSNKFQQLVRPPITLHLTLQYLPQKQMVKFHYRNGLGDCSRGALRVEELPA
ncbi:hypothetical protein QWI17_18265 [Gilvimarinus sp. SDUM040013]|uniref:ApeI dehydratase-like domain-containing protein n=1 Tax=Gilvimarinus gilvus TaxID=3058038 RepID=A0ABU4S597_9GAMM|nr:hypothetical protein [Gilvimarinus sp. SDUM040013]MDO3387794.1 hypothetical protein [Gilvimarinus sp. SDUM040013]MDX6851063.1 hypothetical protein [Gilvimarinus sp. SDUM040013]